MLSEGYMPAPSEGNPFVISGGEEGVRACGRAWLGAEDVDRRWGRVVCRRVYIVHTMSSGMYGVYNITPAPSALPQLHYGVGVHVLERGYYCTFVP